MDFALFPSCVSFTRDIFQTFSTQCDIIFKDNSTRPLLMISAVIKLPGGFIYDHFYLSPDYRSPFIQRASWFEDIVIRCVRYAFAYIPAKIGRIFFSKPVALPFLRFRMLRHGYFRSPIHWHEVMEVCLSPFSYQVSIY